MEINPNQPQSQTKVPPPPTPEVSVRTMQSDIKSIAQGEVSPTPEIVTQRQSFNNREPSFIPEATGTMMIEEGTEPRKSHRGLWTIITIVVIIALVAIGYFVIYPLMSPPVVEPVAEATQPTPTPEPVLAPHSSAFSNSVVLIPQVILKLDTVSRENILQGLTDQSVLVSDGLTEVVLQDATGGQLSFSTFFAALLPNFLDGQSVSTYIENDFTAYIYKDKFGVWPGYITTLRPEGAATLGQWLASFEKADLSALFVTAPGTLDAFKDGTVKGVADRFATGATAGASISYAVTANNLHISTSFDGLKTALGALGY
ncbi:MAG: hypothetical protein Q7R62_03490 [bacterium]|nr:hypothetical protein [bacterium]